MSRAESCYNGEPFLATIFVYDDYMCSQEKTDKFYWVVVKNVSAKQVAVMFFSALLDAVPQVELISTSRIGGGNKNVAGYGALDNFSCHLFRNKIARQVTEKNCFV